MFMAPWLNFFCLVMGLFSASLFTYLAAVFLVGESEIERERMRYARFSKQVMIVTIILAAFVFVVAGQYGNSLVEKFLHSAVSIIMLLIAVLLCPVTWYFLNKEKNKTLYLRVGVGVQVTVILIGWFYTQFPVLIAVKNGAPLDFYNTQAPPATLHQLLIALIAGLLLVIPGFVYLFQMFKVKNT